MPILWHYSDPSAVPVYTLSEQECIPVGCVPPAAVAIGVGGVCLSACWDAPPGVGLETPLGVGLETICGCGDPPGQTPQPPPRCGPGDAPPDVGLTSPLGVGLETPSGQTPQLPLPPGCGPGETPPGQTPQLPPWMWAWRPARHAGIPPHTPLPRPAAKLGYHLQCMLGYQPPP